MSYLSTSIGINFIKHNLPSSDCGEVPQPVKLKHCRGRGTSKEVQNCWLFGESLNILTDLKHNSMAAIVLLWVNLFGTYSYFFAGWKNKEASLFWHNETIR